MLSQFSKTRCTVAGAASSLFIAAIIAGLTTPVVAAIEAIPRYFPHYVQPVPQAEYILPDGSIAEGGAEHVHFILERFNALFQRSHSNIRFTDQSKGATSAIPLLTHGKILFGSMGRGITPSEAKAYENS